MITKNIRTLMAVLAICLLSLVSSCANAPSPEEAEKAEAMAVAQACYDKLLEGDYDGFLAFRADFDKIPEALRPQLADAYKMYMATEEQLHKGIKKFTATRAERDTTQNVMQVFMIIDYVDGTQEETVLPMVSSPDGQWLMK